MEVARKGGIRKTFTVRLTAAEPVEERTAQRERGGAEDSPDKGNENPAAGATIERIGVRVAPLTSDATQELGLPTTTRGVLVEEVDPSGPAADQLVGIDSRSPDVILSVNDTPVKTPAELRSAIRDVARGGIVTMIVYNRQAGQGGGGRRVVRLRLGE